jgi:hypothetical protein
MTSTTVLKAASSADFLAALTRVAGFQASNSLFIVQFKNHRSNGVARLDLPDEVLTLDAPLADWLSLVVNLSRGTEPVALVMTSDHTLSAEPGTSDLGILAGILKLALNDRGMGTRDLCVIAADGWATFQHEARPDRRDLAEIRSSALASDDTPPTLDQWREHENRTPGTSSDLAEWVTRQTRTEPIPA